MTSSLDCSIIKAKAWGLLEGVRVACFFSIGSLVVEGDYLVVISSIR